jgi:hypothetical protein
MYSNFKQVNASSLRGVSESPGTMNEIAQLAVEPNGDMLAK